MPQETTPQFNFRSSLISCAVAAVVLVVMILANLFSSQVSRAWALATTHQPETFTELYFNSSKQAPLPSSAPVGQSRTFSFHLSNHEHRQFHYTYRVTTTTQDRTTPIITGSVDLADGQGTDIKVTFSSTIPSSTSIITVALENPTEEIHFRSES